MKMRSRCGFVARMWRGEGWGCGWEGARGAQGTSGREIQDAKKKPALPPLPPLESRPPPRGEPDNNFLPFLENWGEGIDLRKRVGS